MGQHRDDGKTPNQDDPQDAGNNTVSRKPYVAPVLVEYGTIAKLTQGSLTRKTDGANTRQQKACL